MSWLIIDSKILFVLMMWILAVFGFGGSVLRIYERVCGLKIFPKMLWLELFVSFILGVALLSFIVQVLNFFIPLYAPLSLVFLFFGFGLFVWLYARLLTQWRIILSGLFAFIIVGILSLYHDSYGDSVNYHIQIVTWIQESPLIFGLGNIHGRLGFNGIIYNFYALTDVSQIFPHLRSFIGNEIVYFGLFFSIFHLLLSKISTKPALFVLFSSLAFPFILQHGEFRGLYCEGIGAVLGILVITLIFVALESKHSLADSLSTSESKDSNIPLGHIFALSFIIAFFAALVKIANTGLFAAILVCFVYVYKAQIFSKPFLRSYTLLALFSLIYALPWALKGYMTSGMIAYPAGVGYIESLSWAVSNTQRENEVCWIMSWAREPGKNCVEVLANYEWLKKWLLMETRYFSWYFKWFVYGYWAALALATLLLILPKKLYAHKDYKAYILLFVGVMLGVIFWFASGPDPRFGMVYLIPLFGVLYTHNFTLISSLKHKVLKILLSLGFFATLYPLFALRKVYLVWIWGLWIVYNAKSLKTHRIITALMLLVSLWGVYTIYGKNMPKDIQTTQKIKPIFVSERTTDFDVKVYVRKNNLEEGFKSVDYEPLPTTPHWKPQIKQESIIGRKAYINTQKEQ